ncbi:hypothetical protein G0Q06_10885 [Puniceicoccales bacterium CK1056]|uniref:DUF7305 domain-containing protein n=1 Tax=Oceanipulchritudo coccoides TaxID=2706888 RepID=A0A6B2M1Z9_9BACT|nr:hypothetical protein [Oceanipulchritudo coccoides]NDV62958.1 hypothetical protein [Oceanipulchritudo coccoides]
MLALKNNTRGSIMIAALIITLVTGTLVGLFLKTVSQEVANTHRARMGFQAINLAEAGVEYAMHGMIEDNLDTAWTSTSGGGYYKDNFPHIDITSEAKNDQDSRLYRVRSSLRNDNRSLRVYLEPEWINPDGDKVPVVISEGLVTLNNGMLVRKQIRVEMEKGSSKPWKRGWGNGILGKDSVTFVGGNVFVDSYSSSAGPYDVTTNRRDNGSVASNEVVSGAVSIGNATVVGNVATGGGKPDIGPNGSIRDLTDYENGVTGIDWDRVALDFYADLPEPELPTLTTPQTSLPSTFSASTLIPGSLAVSQLKAEFPSLEFSTKSESIGKGLKVEVIEFAYIDTDNDGTYDTSSEIKYENIALVTEEAYKLTEIDVHSSELYLFSGETQIVVDNEDINTPADTIINGGMLLGSSASLEFYLAGSLTVTGPEAAMINDTGRPPNLQIYVAELNSDWDTSVYMGGNGTLSGAVYSPSSSLEFKGGGGGGDVFGAVVGETIKFSGTYKFHYDEDLANINDDDDDDGDFVPVVTAWRELNYAGERISSWEDLKKSGL